MFAKLRRLLKSRDSAAASSAPAAGRPLPQPHLLFTFHGRTRLWPGLGQQFFSREAAFRETIERCSDAAERLLGFGLRDVFVPGRPQFAGSPQLIEQRIIVLSCALELALCEVWRSHGVEPAAALGCSCGEVAAAYAAGALTLDEAAAVACSLAPLLTRKPAKGYFVRLEVGYEKALRLGRAAPAALDILLDAGPAQSLAFCTAPDLEDVRRFLSESGVGHHPFPAEWAHHTPRANALAETADELYRPRPRPLARPLYSSHAGGLFPPGALLSADHWYRAVVEPARFGYATCAALADGYDVVLDVCCRPWLKDAVEESAKTLNRPALILDTMSMGEPELATWEESLRRLRGMGLVKNGGGGSGREGGATAAPAAPRLSDSLNLLSPEVVRDPYPHYAALRGTGSVHYLKQHGFWIVLDYDDVADALKRPEIFSSVRPAVRFDPVLTEADPPAHTRVRRILSPYFSAQSAKGLEGYVRDCAVRLLRESGRPAEFDLVGGFAAPLTEMTITRLLGLSDEDADSLRRHLSPHRRHADGRLFAALEEWVRGYAARLLARPDESLGGRLLAGEGEAALAPEEVITLLKLLWAAGTHTTERLIATSALTLLRHPEVREEVQGDPALLPAFMEEVLRLDTPELMAWRVTREEVVLSGVTIPAGAEVKLCVAAANRDPAKFADPDRLSLRRSPNNHLSFGGGQHYCLGAPLARLEARLALEALFAEWPDFAAVRPLHVLSYFEEYHSRTLNELFVAAG